MNKPILSIAIPTKDRYEYLRILISELLSHESQDFEVVIQDNSIENTGFKKFLESLNDSRVRYNHRTTKMAMRENMDLSIGACSGDYVCVLGDDDGIVMSESLKLLRYLKENKIDAAIPNKVSYDWPDNVHAIWKGALSGRVRYRKFTRDFERLEAQTELSKLYKQGFSYGLGRLARVYHGFVLREKLEQLKAETGSHCPGPSPDMANAVGLCKFIDSYIQVNKPTIISGHAKKSGGGMGGRKTHHAKLEKAPFMPANLVENWNKKIPFFWSSATIYAESALKALELTSQLDISKVNFNYLYAQCLVFEKPYSKYVFETLKKNKTTLTWASQYIVVQYYCGLIMFRRGLNLLKNVYAHRISRKRLPYANDMSEVIRIMSQDKWSK